MLDTLNAKVTTMIITVIRAHALQMIDNKHRHTLWYTLTVLTTLVAWSNHGLITMTSCVRYGVSNSKNYQSWVLYWLSVRRIHPDKRASNQCFMSMTVSWTAAATQWTVTLYAMMTSSNGNIFRVTGLLWWEFTCHRWILLIKASDAELWCFRWSALGQTVEQTIESLVIWDTIAPIMWLHYDDVVMGTMASQITSLTIVYSTIYSDAAQRKHQSSASLAFVRGIHRGPVNSPHKWPVTRKVFPFDDVIMDPARKWIVIAFNPSVSLSKSIKPFMFALFMSAFWDYNYFH